MPVTSTDQVPTTDTGTPATTVPAGFNANPDGPDLTVFYDGSCGFCTRQASLIKGHFGLAVDTVSTASPGVHRTWGLDPERTSGEIIVRDRTGREWDGADAIARLLASSRRTWIIGRAMMLPGIRTIAGRAYRIIARNRHRLA